MGRVTIQPSILICGAGVSPAGVQPRRPRRNSHNSVHHPIQTLSGFVAAILALVIVAGDVSAQQRTKPAAPPTKKAAATEEQPPPVSEKESTPEPDRKPALDPDEIRATVDDLDRERQRQALMELGWRAAAGKGKSSSRPIRGHYVLSHYQFDMYSIIREPQVSGCPDRRRCQPEKGGQGVRVIGRPSSRRIANDTPKGKRLRSECRVFSEARWWLQRDEAARSAADRSRRIAFPGCSIAMRAGDQRVDFSWHCA